MVTGAVFPEAPAGQIQRPRQVLAAAADFLAQNGLGVGSQLLPGQGGAGVPADTAGGLSVLRQGSVGAGQQSIVCLKRFIIFQKKKVAVAVLQIPHEGDLIGVGILGVLVHGVRDQVLMELHRHLAVPVGVAAQGGKGLLDGRRRGVGQGVFPHIGDLVVGPDLTQPQGAVGNVQHRQTDHRPGDHHPLVIVPPVPPFLAGRGVRGQGIGLHIPQFPVQV